MKKGAKKRVRRTKKRMDNPCCHILLVPTWSSPSEDWFREPDEMKHQMGHMFKEIYKI
jgi:hypothetical protein